MGLLTDFSKSACTGAISDIHAQPSSFQLLFHLDLGAIAMRVVSSTATVHLLLAAGLQGHM
jgi:hypothetical protein